jgi:hypothetical protein
MKTFTKSTLLITTTLIIGFVLGLLVHSLMVGNRINEFQRLRKKGGLVKHLEDIIQPTSEQKEKITPILEGYIKRIEPFMLKFRSETRNIMDSLRLELEPILTEQQLEKLEKNLRRRKESIKPR